MSEAQLCGILELLLPRAVLELIHHRTRCLELPVLHKLIGSLAVHVEILVLGSQLLTVLIALVEVYLNPVGHALHEPQELCPLLWCLHLRAVDLYGCHGKELGKRKLLLGLVDPSVFIQEVDCFIVLPIVFALLQEQPRLAHAMIQLSDLGMLLGRPKAVPGLDPDLVFLRIRVVHFACMHHEELPRQVLPPCGLEAVRCVDALAAAQEQLPGRQVIILGEVLGVRHDVLCLRLGQKVVVARLLEALDCKLEQAIAPQVLPLLTPLLLAVCFRHSRHSWL
mmetsp:Transcript_11144/g.27328  ORF Transcript_11144/g.27328 Transcript_11144/m.27328 type:complete len:280 (-) Transcript_11144:1149-1988(-)